MLKCRANAAFGVVAMAHPAGYALEIQRFATFCQSRDIVLCLGGAAQQEGG